MPENAVTVASGALKWLRERRIALNISDRSGLQELGSSLAQGHGD